MAESCLLWQLMGMLHAFINILDCLMAPCLVYNMTMIQYKVGVASLAAAWFIHWPVAVASAWFIWTPTSWLIPELAICDMVYMRVLQLPRDTSLCCYEITHARLLFLYHTEVI